MKTAIMMIGAPGSGKSSLRRQLVRFIRSLGLTVQVVCPDEIREAICGDSADQSQEERVWKIVDELLVHYLSCCQVVILDATNSIPIYRLEVIGLLKSHGANQVIGVVCHPTLETCQFRNQSRQRAAPSSIVEIFWQRIESWPPSCEEFDLLIAGDVEVGQADA